MNPSQSPLDTARTVPTLDEVSAQVRTWVDAAATRHVPGPAKMLSDLLQDPNGLDFTLAFVDRVIRPEDPHAAAVELRRLAQDPPAFLPAALRGVIALGGAASTLVPSLVVPTAQATMRRMVGHLILDARPRPLSSAIQRLTADGTKLNINLLGEAVLGAQEADRRLQGVRELVAREDVDYASIKVSSIVDHLPLWAADETVDHIVETLLPLYLEATRGENPTFLNMDMEEYRDLELTLQVFEKLLDRPELASLHAGIVLQAYLPDAPSAMARLRRFAERRVADGGEPLKVRLVKGANLAMEQVDASVHGWTQAPLLSKEETDAQYKRMLLEALDPEKLEAVHLGVAGHNLFDVAFAHLLMQSRGIPAGPGHGVEFEMLAGMTPGQQAVVREATGTMRLYVPIVHPRHFDVAVSYLVRRLEENASSQNFLSAAFELDSSESLFAREQQRFSRALDRALRETSLPTHRDQDRGAEVADGQTALQLGDPALPAVPGAFRNTPDTDLSTP
ncbi:MAG: proline dehydrogenase family protein, partial [Brachybacterium sp.]|nr:proline dehydrogenase family protein [Brachybacterium sp.]